MKPTIFPIEQELFEILNPNYHAFQIECMKNQRSNSSFSNTEKNQEEDQEKDIEPDLEKDQNNEKDLVKDERIDQLKIEDKDQEIQVKKHNHEKPKPKEIWVHLSCALWIPEVYFDENKEKSNISGLDLIESWRFSMQCGVCRMKKMSWYVFRNH